MKKLTTSILVLVATLLAFTMPGLAASNSATVSVSWTVEAQYSLTITSNSSSLSSSSSSNSVQDVFEIPEPTDQDLKRGFIEENNAIELEASSNTEWIVQVSAEDNTLGSSYEGDFEKPLSDLRVRGQGGFKQISTDATTIASGDPGTHQFGVDYRVNFDEDYKPGDYQATLTYVISTP